MMNSKLLNKLMIAVESSNPVRVISIITFFVSLISFVTVYSVIFTIFGNVETLYSILSILMPAMMAPPTLLLGFKLIKHMNYYKKEWETVIEQNRQKDLQLFEQERFVIIGEMLSNISHQWRQPLNAINLTMLSARVEQATGKLDDASLITAFDTIESNTHYLSNTIDDFRSFFQNKDVTKMVSLSTIINELEAITKEIFKKSSISLSFSFENGLDQKLMLASSISQTLLNMLINARDALDTINGSNKYVKTSVLSNDDGIVITVCDNGEGISPEILHHIFDPYFSTKEAKSGSGIGLHMSRQIIEKVFGGSISVDTSIKQGVCFMVRLPYSDKCQLKEAENG